MEITMRHGLKLIIDDADYHLISGSTWRALRNYQYKDFFKPKGVVATINRKTVQIHRLIMQAPKGVVVDHINGDPLDNRRSNLRLCSIMENSWNSKGNARSHSGLKGVSREDTKWRARLTVNGKAIRIGRFDTQEQAFDAFKAAVVKYHGEFARYE